MSDELKKFLQYELKELKQNKIRAGALVACFVVLLIFWASEDDSAEEIILTESPPLTKDLPVKVLPTDKTPDGMKVVMGAKPDALFVGDPFAEEEPAPQPPPPPIQKPLPTIPAPPVLVTPPHRASESESLKEKILLTGTAISGENKMAMFLRGEKTLFLTVGDEIGGRKISDITTEFVTFTDGERIYLQKELN